MQWRSGGGGGGGSRMVVASISCTSPCACSYVSLAVHVCVWASVCVRACVCMRMLAHNIFLQNYTISFQTGIYRPTYLQPAHYRQTSPCSCNDDECCTRTQGKRLGRRRWENTAWTLSQKRPAGWRTSTAQHQIWQWPRTQLRSPVRDWRRICSLRKMPLPQLYGRLMGFTVSNSDSGIVSHATLVGMVLGRWQWSQGTTLAQVQHIHIQQFHPLI